MATIKDRVEADLQEAAKSILTGVQVADGVRNEVIDTGKHLFEAITDPARTAISQGPTATLSYVESMLPAVQLQDEVKTVAKAALGNDEAKARLEKTADTALNIVTAIPESLGQNAARGELAAKAGKPHEFGGALGAIAMTVIGGPEGKAVEAAAVAGVKDVAIEGVLVDTAVGTTTKDVAATVSLSTPTGLPATTPSVLSAPTPQYSTVSNALENSNLPEVAKSVLSPVAKVLDEGKNTILTQAPKTVSEHIAQARNDSFKRDGNIFEQALNAKDGTHIDAATGLTIAEKTAYDIWNKAQVPARAEFYNDVFTHRPDIAAQLEQQGITAHGVKNLLMSDVNDGLIGIKPYEGYQAPSYTHGYEADKALAKEWGIEYREQKQGWGGVLQDLTGKNELTMNQELQNAKKAVAAAGELQTAIHQDVAKRILLPDLPRNPELDAKVQQLLAVKLENGAASAEARQALPAELRALPAKHLEALQENAQQAVATDHLRLSTDRQATPLIGGSEHGAAQAETNVAVIAYNQQAQAIRGHFAQSLSIVNTQAPVANFVPLTEAQIAAKRDVERFTKDNSPLGNATNIILDTANGYSGAGYNMGHIEKKLLAEQGAISDYSHFAAGVKRGVQKTATTAGVALTAVNAPIVLPAAFVGTVATRMILNNESASAAIKGTMTAVTDYARSLLPTTDAATTKPTTLIDTLSKTSDGSLTPQSQRVLELVNERAQQQVGTAPDIGP